MNKHYLPIFLFCALAYQSSTAEEVAKAIIVKGKVYAITSDKKEIPLSANQAIDEGAIIKTAEKSFVKLLFIDKSQMNLGPSSEMAVTTFPKDKAGIITLLQGQIRSKVSKDYLDNKQKDQSKLFIQTKTAAMGVRGTDFQVTYNNENKLTSLVTFEGRVAMAKLESEKFANSQSSLEKIVSSEKSVMVTQGEYSGVGKGHERTSLPVKISPVQLSTLVKNDTFESSRGNNTADSKTESARSMLPPGVSSKEFSSTASIEQNLAKVVSTESIKEIIKEEKGVNTITIKPPAEGSFDSKTGAFAPPAGGYVDIKTGLYISPDPKTSTFDANTGVYIVDAKSGGVNPTTGEYMPPRIEGKETVLTPDGKIILASEPVRAPASTATGTKPSTTEKAPILAPPPQVIIFGVQPAAPKEAPILINDTRAPAAVINPCDTNPTLCSTTTKYENTAPTIKVNDFSRVKFIFTNGD